MKLLLVLLGFCGLAAHAADTTYNVKILTPETALKAAQAALKKCRDGGYQATVAVVDRMGVVQVLLRDRFAGPHTPATATAKAWTAVSFRATTLELDELSQPGRPSAGIRHLPGVVAIGGGRPVESRGSIVGGIGVSGAPGGAADDACARAGIAAIEDKLVLD